MLKHEFYRKYANVILSKRDIPLSTIHNPITLNQIYHEMKTHDEAIRTEERAQKKLLEQAEEIFNLLK